MIAIGRETAGVRRRAQRRGVPRRMVSRVPPFVLCVAWALSLAACRQSGESKRSGRAAASQRGTTARFQGIADRGTTPSESLATFEPSLLLSDARTIQYAVEVPQIQAFLDGEPPWIVTVTIVAECANAQAARELQRRLTPIQSLIADCLSHKKIDQVRTLAGKLALKEEILAVMQRSMRNPAIKQIYYTELNFAPASR